MRKKKGGLRVVNEKGEGGLSDFLYWNLEYTDRDTGMKGMCTGKGFTYDELGKLLADIIRHEIVHYKKSDSLVEAKLRRKQLMKAMLEPIKEEEERRKWM